MTVYNSISWLGQACVIDALVAIYPETQAVVKGMEPDKSRSKNTSLTPLAHERYKNASFEMKSES